MISCGLRNKTYSYMYILIKNEAAIAFENEDRETLKKEYFSPYKIPHVLHKPWQEKGI